jgi:autotransporter-associated beta strand protein
MSALGRSLPLLFCAAALLAVPLTHAGTTENAVWTGGGSTDNWNDTANWSSGNQPQGNDANTVIHFAGFTRTTPNNDYGPFTLESQIVFDSGASSFTLDGNAIKLNFKIENNSSVLQTYNMSGLSLAPTNSGGVVELDPSAGDLTINTPGSAIFLDNNAELDVFGSHVLTLNGSVQNGGGSTGKFVLKGTATVIFNAANTYTGGTFINNGSLQFDTGGSASGTLTLGDTTGSNSSSIYIRPATGGKTADNDITVRSGSTGTTTIGGLNTSGTNSYSGTITLNRGVNLDAASGGTVSFNTITASGPQTATITGGGTIQFTGTSDNLNVGATVNSGTLQLAKTSSGSVHAVGTGLTVNNGGTVVLGGTGGDQIYTGSFVTINNGGTFKTSGVSEGSSTTGSTAGVGALTLQGGATIDFAVGANGSTLSAASGAVTGAGTVSILNWTGSLFADNGSSTNDRLLFQGDPGFTSDQLAQFQFYDDSGNALGTGATEVAFNGWTEIVPIPEARTSIVAFLALGILVFGRRPALSRKRR